MRRLTFFLVLMCAVLFSIVRSDASSVVNIDKADLMFFIDTTGSMGSYIESVRNNLSSFAHYLADHGINMRFAVIEFKDVTADGADSTKINTFADGAVWTSDISEVESVLASIDVDGGGDGPETPMEAITKFLKTATIRTNARQFIFLLTDANAKDITNDTDITNKAEVISLLRRNNIYTSVVGEPSYEEHYHDLYTETGGKFIDITSSNYYELMLEIADWIVEYIDTDGDGLLDSWETDGIDIDGDGSMDVDLPAMGANVNSPDIFVYYDWMYKAPDKWPFGISVGEKNMKPTPATLDAVVRQFRNHGIRLHIIEGQAIAYEDVFELGHLYSNWNRIAAEYFPRQYWNIARYCLFVNKIDNGDVSPLELCGIAEDIPGQFFVVASGLMRDNMIHRFGTMLLEGELVYVEMETGITFMHELGHTLGLKHGGDDHVHYKPNYLSVMNYLYSATGLVIDDVFERLNYSEYELPSIDEQNVNENDGLDPEGVTGKRVDGLSAKWKLAEAFYLGDEPGNTHVKNKDSVSGRSVDFNGNGKIETSIAVDFYVKSSDTNTSTQIIPKSYNDWANIKFRGGAIGGLNVMMSGDLPMLIPPDASRPIIEELTLTEAMSLDLIGNPDDCTIRSIMPDILFTSATSQNIRITVENLFSSETTAALEVKSALLDETFRVSVDLEPHGSADVIIAVKKSLTAGEYALECVLTCANNVSSDVAHIIHVLGINPLMVEEGGNLTVDGSSFGGCVPVIEDTSIATMNGAVIHGEKVGQTFLLLKDGDETICTVPIYVTAMVVSAPEPEPVSEPEPVISGDSQIDTPGEMGIKSSSGGCNAGFVAFFTVMCIFAVARKK